MATPPLPPPPPVNEVNVKGNVKVKGCAQRAVRLGYEAAMKMVKEAVGVELEHCDEGQRGQGQGVVVICTPMLNPILQNGPVCGLIALVEGVEILVRDRNDVNLDVDPDDLLQAAIHQGMTSHGEMFSAADMQRLAKSYFHLESQLIDTEGMDLGSIWRVLGSHLLQGKVALVPYDADYNHGPALRKGHAAHWAVVHGITIPDLEPCDLDDPIKVFDPTTPQNQAQSSQFSKVFENAQCPPSPCHVIAHHGKSAQVAVWPFAKLMKSNQNLAEISPKITSAPPQETYVLRDIKTELCSKLLLLDKPSGT